VAVDSGSEKGWRLRQFDTCQLLPWDFRLLDDATKQQINTIRKACADVWGTDILSGRVLPITLNPRFDVPLNIDKCFSFFQRWSQYAARSGQLAASMKDWDSSQIVVREQAF
jgi:hypothetical protein